MKNSFSIQGTYHYFQEAFTFSSDLKMKTMSFPQYEYSLFYLDTMVDSQVFQEHIVKPLSIRPDANTKEVITVQDMKETEDLDEAVKALVQGKTVLQMDGDSVLLLLGTELHKGRQINFPTNERVLRGSREAFVEHLETNLNLLRKRIASPDLVVKYFTIGRVSQTKVSVIYIKGIANPKVTNLIEKRLQKVDIDSIYAPGFIQEFVQDKRFSLFPQMLTSERLDRTRAYLMEGKAAIIMEGSPDASIMPVSFWAFFQSPDDYQINWLIGSAIRMLRITCFFIALGLPGLYTSLVVFHSYILPMNMALTVQGALKYITFHPASEVILLLVALEILKEAAVRLASPIGQVVGVVGGIIIGTAVVQSNLISNTAVVVAAFTGMASYLIPSYEMSNSIRLLNIPVILLSALFGLVGLVFSFLMLNIYLCRMNTMGLPYYYPAFADSGVKDTLIRAPMWSLRKRPKEAAPINRQRLGNPEGWKE
ncbi:spore germination protein [Neobacillus sp. M.A.Huq-85]|nr:spore germination protein [Neobacillus cucumis]